MADQLAGAKRCPFSGEVSLALGGFLETSAFAFLRSGSNGSCDADSLDFARKVHLLIQNSYVSRYKFI